MFCTKRKRNGGLEEEEAKKGGCRSCRACVSRASLLLSADTTRVTRSRLPSWCGKNDRNTRTGEADEDADEDSEEGAGVH